MYLSRIKEETEGRNVYILHVTVKHLQFEYIYLNCPVYEICMKVHGLSTEHWK